MGSGQESQVTKTCFGGGGGPVKSSAGCVQVVQGCGEVAEGRCVWVNLSPRR